MTPAAVDVISKDILGNRFPCVRIFSLSLNTGLGGQKQAKIFKPLSVDTRTQVMMKLFCDYTVLQGRNII